MKRVVILLLALGAVYLAIQLAPMIWFMLNLRDNCQDWESLARNDERLAPIIELAKDIAANPEGYDFRLMSRMSVSEEKIREFERIGFDWSVLQSRPNTAHIFIQPIGAPLQDDDNFYRYQNIKAVQFGYGREFIEVKVDPAASFSDYSDIMDHPKTRIVSDEVAYYCIW
ncbi:MAG: hypothetical protein HWE25_01425 [Alphaproteobacteria bacterium]|nr:hypothetical protein [Alphaproteobacteria bacterium]